MGAFKKMLSDNRYNMEKNRIFLISILIIVYIIIFYSFFVEALDKSRHEIGADKINGLGITGEGNTICLIDDGVDYTNEYLGGCTKVQYEAGTCPTVVVGRNIVDNDTDILPHPDHYHGTHIPGILISSHSKYKGISPNAKLAVVKVYSDITNSTSCQAFIDSINWCVNNSE